MTLDSFAVSHILGRTTIYEKPWQSRRLITRLIGEGLLGSEGQVHRRQASCYCTWGFVGTIDDHVFVLQRKVSNPAFSPQNLRAFMPMFFQKAEEVKT